MTRFRAVSLSMIAWGAAVLVITALTSLDAAGQHTRDERDHADSHEAGHDDHPNHDEPVSGQAGHGEKSEGGVVELSPESIRAADIHVTALKSELLPEFISAPGEIQLNQYRSAEVTPLIDAVVVKRHARLGDKVKAGQPLITLASIEVAAAQGELRIVANEWQRVRKLGRGVVSEKRYVQARVAYEQGRLKLSAYGLDNKQINAVVTGRIKVALGRFQLNAPVSGTVLRDDFHVGQHIKAGYSLFLIADERRFWVKANLTPLQADHIEVGVPAQVSIGGYWHEGMSHPEASYTQRADANHPSAYRGHTRRQAPSRRRVRSGRHRRASRPRKTHVGGARVGPGAGRRRELDGVRRTQTRSFQTDPHSPGHDTR